MNASAVCSIVSCASGQHQRRRSTTIEGRRRLGRAYRERSHVGQVASRAQKKIAADATLTVAGLSAAVATGGLSIPAGIGAAAAGYKAYQDYRNAPAIFLWKALQQSKKQSLTWPPTSTGFVCSDSGTVRAAEQEGSRVSSTSLRRPSLQRSTSAALFAARGGRRSDVRHCARDGRGTE